MTFMFLIIILGTTDKRAPQGFAPIAIGLGLTLIHLISIPVTNTLSESCTQYRCSVICRGLGNFTIMAVLGCTDCRRVFRGYRVSLAGKRIRPADWLVPKLQLGN